MDLEHPKPITTAPPASPDADAGRPHARPSRKRLWLFLLKMSVGLALCAIIVVNVDWAEAARSLAGTGLGTVGAMYAILLALVFLSAYKWRVLLSMHGVEYTTLRLSKYYFIAVFFNNFLPTSIGGDGYRVYKTMGNGRSKASAVIAVVMERLTGFATLILLGVGAALLVAADTGMDAALLWLVGLAVVVIGVPLAWRLRSFVPRRLVAATPEKIRKIFTILVEHWDDYLRQPRRSLGVLGISVVFHLGVAFAYLIILRYGAGQSISMAQLITALSITTLAAVLPISFNGLGVYEGTFIYLLAQYGVPPDVSIVPMLLNRGLLIAMSLAGAGVYLLDTAGDASRPPAGAEIGR